MSLKEEGNEPAVKHPNPIDRNRSIVWARYHVDSNEWVLLALKITRRADESGKEVPSLVTVALVDHNGRPLVEDMIKTSSMVSNDEIARHGVDQSVVFNAKSFDDVIENLNAKIGAKTIVAWDPKMIQGILDELHHLHGAEPRRWKGHDASMEYSRFIGKTDNPLNGYELQELPLLGLSAVDECRSVLKVIQEIAAASQATNSLNGDPSWTAEFYRPKVGAKDKIKGLFGFGS